MFAASLGMSVGDVASGSYALPSTIQDIEATERLCRSARTELAEIANLLAEENLSAIESHVVVTSRPSSAILDYAMPRTSTRSPRRRTVEASHAGGSGV